MMMMMMTLAAVQAYSELTCSFLLMNVDASPDRTVVGCRGETKSILPNVCSAASSVIHSQSPLYFIATPTYL